MQVSATDYSNSGNTPLHFNQCVKKNLRQPALGATLLQRVLFFGKPPWG